MGGEPGVPGSFAWKELLPRSPQLGSNLGLGQRAAARRQHGRRAAAPVPGHRVERDAIGQFLRGDPGRFVVEGDEVVAVRSTSIAAMGLGQADVEPASVQVPGERGVGGEQE